MKTFKKLSAMLILSSMFLAGCNFSDFLDALTDPSNIGLPGGSETQTEEGQGEGQTTPEEDDGLVKVITPTVTSKSLIVGASFTLDYSVSPSTAVNKDVNIASTNNAIASYNVSTRKVSAKAAGECDIVFTAADNGGATSSCHISVTEPTSETVYVTGIGVTTNTKSLNVGGSFTLSYTVTPTNATSKDVDVSISNSSVISYASSTKKVTALASGTSTITIEAKDGGGASAVVTVNVTQKVTSISLSPSSLSLEVGETSSLTASVLPSNASNKQVTWSSTNTSVATVSTSGVVTAVKAGSATIKATAKDGSNVYGSASVTVTGGSTIVDEGDYSSTILIYMCGADLESDYANKTSISGQSWTGQGMATMDIMEILSVNNKPSDIEIIIMTGGAKSWTTTTYANYGSYNISSSYNQIHRVNNGKLELLSNNYFGSYKSMGLASTLQDFLEYGLTNYPADKTGLILWNHGGAMQGVCYDEKSSDDSLLDNEVKSAVSGALSNCNMSGQKLEWIGYDACLMQVQDVAEMNSQYFNYMIASEESESGYGWDYDTWIDDLYAKKPTETVLTAIVDGFIKDNGGTSDSSNDQTLSWLDLSYADEYLSAWEAMASAISSKVSSNADAFGDLIDSCKHYADDSYTYYCTFDAKDFINKLASSSKFKPDSSITNAVLNAHNNFVGYSSKGKAAGNSYGLCMFWGLSSDAYQSTYYKTTMTNFTTWRNLSINYGETLSSWGGGGWW